MPETVHQMSDSTGIPREIAARWPLIRPPRTLIGAADPRFPPRVRTFVQVDMRPYRVGCPTCWAPPGVGLRKHAPPEARDRAVCRTGAQSTQTKRISSATPSQETSSCNTLTSEDSSPMGEGTPE